MADQTRIKMKMVTARSSSLVTILPWSWPCWLSDAEADRVLVPNVHLTHLQKVDNIGTPYICHFFTRAKFLESKIYTEERQFFALNL